MTADPNSRDSRSYWAWINALPILVALIFVLLYWSDVPTGHDWVFFQILQSSDSFTDVLSGIWSPQNGHRNFVIQILYLADYYFLGFNVKHFLVLNLIVMMIGWWGSWKLFRVYFQNNILYYFPVTCLWFSLIQYKDFLTTWHLTIHLGILGGVWAIYYIGKSGFKNLLLAYLSFLLSFFSFGNGLIIAPVGLLILLIQKRRKTDILVWIFLAVLTIALYFWNYNVQSSTIKPSAMFHSLMPSISLILKLMANPWAGLMGYFGTLGNLVLLVVGTIYLLTTCLLILKTKSNWRDNVVLYAFTLYSWLVFALISFGRIQGGSAISTAYFTVASQSAIPLIVLCFLFGRDSNREQADIKDYRLFKLVSCVAVFSSVLGLVYGFSWGPYVKGDRVKQRYRVLNFVSFEGNTNACKYLERNNKTVFRKHVRDDIFLHVFELDKFKESNSNYQYTVSDTIIQRMISPVSSFSSIGVLMHAFNPVIGDSIQVAIMDSKMNTYFKATKGAKDVFQDGRFTSDIGFNKIAKGDTIVIRISKKGDSINVPLFDVYPGAPTEFSGNKKSLSCLSVEINPPPELIGYYRQLVLRAKLKHMINIGMRKAT